MPSSPSRCCCCGASIHTVGSLELHEYGFLCGGCKYAMEPFDSSSCGDNCEARQIVLLDDYPESELDLHRQMEAVARREHLTLDRWWA